MGLSGLLGDGGANGDTLSDHGRTMGLRGGVMDSDSGAGLERATSPFASLIADIARYQLAALADADGRARVSELPRLPGDADGGDATAEHRHDSDADYGSGELRNFVAGFLDYGGDAGVVDHAYRVVTECEGSRWAGYYGTPYWSRAQFSSDTWAKVTRATGLTNPDDPYATGANMATWIAMIGSNAAGTRSGWPNCWWAVP